MFLKGGGRTLLSNSVATPLRGVVPSGSTARSDVREDFAKAKPQGNPSPTAIYKNTDHCKRNGLFIFVNIKPAKALLLCTAGTLHICRRQMLHTAQPCFIITPAGVLRMITVTQHIEPGTQSDLPDQIRPALTSQTCLPRQGNNGH